jgi:tetratricopeptide (TPR) repeat protein
MRKWIPILFAVLCGTALYSVSEQLDLGRRMLSDKLYDEALRQFQSVIESSPGSDDAEEALLLSGRLLRDQGRYTEAETTFQRLYDGYPRSSRRAAALAGLAECRYRLGKLSDATHDFSVLSKQYPRTDETRKLLVMQLDALLRSSEFQDVIVRGNDALANDVANPLIPDALALMADAYDRMGETGQADAIIAKLTKDYPSSNARWATTRLQAVRTLSVNGPEAAARQLRSLLTPSTPRDMEESLRLQVAVWLRQAGNHQEAAAELEGLCRKFTASDHLDEYTYLLTDSRFRIGHFREIVDSADSTLFSGSSRRLAQAVLVADAHCGVEDWAIALNGACSVLAQASKDSLLYRALIVKSCALEGLHRYREAILVLQDALRRFPSLSDTPDLYRRIGDLWGLRLRKSDEALRFYRQSAALSVTNDPRTILATASILLQTDRPGEAEEELKAFDAEAPENRPYVDEYRRLSALAGIRKSDPEGAIRNMATVLARYAADEDKSKLQTGMAKTVAESGHDYISALALLPDTRENLSLRVDFLLRQAELMQLEGNPDSARTLITGAENRLDGISDAARQAEIRLDILRLTDAPDKAVYYRKLGEYLVAYPNAIDRWKLDLARYRKAMGLNPEDLYQSLRNDGTISDSDYRSSRLELAESRYRAGDRPSADRAFREAASLLTIDRPNAFYHALLCNPHPEETVADLRFLLDNAGTFSERNAAVLHTADLLVRAGQNTMALEVLDSMPESARNAEYWRLRSQLLESTGNLRLAMEALMRITDKDLSTLNRLAGLQYRLGDYAMAEYSYGLLLQKDPGNATTYRTTLGHIAFLTERYQDTVDRYQPLLSATGPIDPIRESIISYYRLGNRPKAEELRKRFKDRFADDNRINAQIRLAEGIYDLKALPADGVKVFDDLLKDKNTPDDVKTEAYYWRGVAKNQLKDDTGAMADFKLAAGASDARIAARANLKLGNLSYAGEKYPDALAYYDKVMAMDSTGTLARDAAHNYAVVCKTLGEWERAVAAYERILDRWGDKGLQGETLFDIAYCYYRDKKYAHAVETFDKAMPMLDSSQSKAEALYWRAESLFGLEQWDQAVSAFLKVAYSYPDIVQWAATAELRTAEAYQRQGSPDKCRAMLDRIVEKYGADSQWGREAVQMRQGM